MEFDLLKWSAWAPGLTSTEDWRQWLSAPENPEGEASPDVSFMPAMQRRRLSRMARMGFRGMEACLDQGQPALPIVFASRHGELSRSHALLECLARDEGLSPKDFSLSVHNATTGLYSIFRDNHEPSTAIAAGVDTLPTGLMEALVQSHTRDGECLFVWVEQSMPEFYRHYLPAQSPTACLAMRVAPPGRGGRRLRLAMDPARTGEAAATETAVLHHLLAILLDEAGATAGWNGARCRWTLEAVNVAA